MLNWQLKRFDELDAHALYAALKLRCDVFVVEQDCPYPELDNQDQDALHLLGWQDGDTSKLAAYLRILTSSNAKEVSIGRVVTSADARGHGYGRELMLKGIEIVGTRFPSSAIRLSAQFHLLNFYGELGFEQVSEPYDEDGIPHIAMLKQAIDTEV